MFHRASALASVLLGASVGLLGCSSHVVNEERPGITKEEARARHGVDQNGNDMCAAAGYYDDGVCDDFCPQIDKQDCSPKGECPNPNDPAVHYIGKPGSDVCIADSLSCPSGQVMFATADCGCGCVDVGQSCGGLTGKTCGAGFFCSYSAGACVTTGDQAGTCQPIPDVCNDLYAPVCGCDGKTYANECDARGAGMNVDRQGPCDGAPLGSSCGGATGATCDKGLFCSYPPGVCGGDGAGTCQPIEDVCDDIYAPVCGCDGKTYPSACQASAESMSVAHEGECNSAGTPCGGLLKDACGIGFFCDYPPEAVCGAGDAAGSCKPMPDACTDEVAPVCGCDGKTYITACTANASGVSVAHKDACN